MVGLNFVLGVSSGWVADNEARSEEPDMTKTIENATVVGMALALLVLCGAAHAQAPLHGRISFDSGGSMVRGSGDGDWSYATTNTLVLPGDGLWVDKTGVLELELAGGSFLRMADGSKIDVLSFPPAGHLRAWTGSFCVQRVRRSTGNLLFEAPSCNVEIAGDSQVRIDILGSGATTVTVRWGRADVRTDGGQNVVLRTGLECYVDPGFLPSEPRPFDKREEDDFDAWCRDRARLIAVGSQTIPPPVSIKTGTIGLADLSPHGEWVYVDSSYYWRPTVANYVPYRRGRWSYVGGSGYVWVGDYPFSYATSHYGRWRHHDRHGWIWGYSDIWGPAWVATVRYGSNFMWCPLDPWDRPIYYGSDYYNVGGLRFGMGASTYCRADDLLWGIGRNHPMTRSIVSGVNVRDIYAWNINVNPTTTSPVRYRNPSSMRVRDYAPRRSIRGAEAVAGSKRSARSRVATLESSHGRVQYAPTRKNAQGGRTVVAHRERGARVRTVQVDRTAAAAVPALRKRTVQGSKTATPGTRTSVRTQTRSTATNTQVPATRGRIVTGIRTEAKNDAPVRTQTRSTPTRTQVSTPSTGSTDRVLTTTRPSRTTTRTSVAPTRDVAPRTRTTAPSAPRKTTPAPRVTARTTPTRRVTTIGQTQPSSTPTSQPRATRTTPRVQTSIPAPAPRSSSVRTTTPRSYSTQPTTRQSSPPATSRGSVAPTPSFSAPSRRVAPSTISAPSMPQRSSSVSRPSASTPSRSTPHSTSSSTSSRSMRSAPSRSGGRTR